MAIDGDPKVDRVYMKRSGSVQFRFLGEDGKGDFDWVHLERVDSNAKTMPPGTPKRLPRYLFKMEFTELGDLNYDQH